MHGFGCWPLQLTVPEPGALNGSLMGAVDWGGGSSSAGNGLFPLFTDGAGTTVPGPTRWSQRAPGAGQGRIWFGSPYHGLVPSGTYGSLLWHSLGVAARLPGTSAHG